MKRFSNIDQITLSKAKELSKRELLAAMAMQGLLASEAAYGPLHQGCSYSIAEKSIELADVLLKKLNPKKERVGV